MKKEAVNIISQLSKLALTARNTLFASFIIEAPQKSSVLGCFFAKNNTLFFN
jgi:hypothetical protein